MGSVSGHHDQKLLVVATARLLTELPALQAPEQAELAGKLLAGAVASLDGGGGSEAGAGDEEAPEEEYGGYSAAFARLHNAHRPEPDQLPEVTDARTYLAQALGKAAASSPGRLPALVAGQLSPELQQKLAAIVQAAGVAIV